MGTMKRVLVGELMDDPAVDQHDLDLSLRYLRGINRYLGGSRALISHLADWSRTWLKGRPVTLLDVATGSADIPLAARKWALAAGFDLRVTGIDLHERTLELARRHVGPTQGVTVVRGDALRLVEEFGEGSFDYVHAGLFLHHLQDADVERVLTGMHRVARRGIVWNDLLRSRWNYFLVSAAVIGQARIVRHDGKASVAAGFTREEVRALAQRLGLNYAKYRPARLFYRFTLAGEKPIGTNGQSPVAAA